MFTRPIGVSPSNRRSPSVGGKAQGAESFLLRVRNKLQWPAAERQNWVNPCTPAADEPMPAVGLSGAGGPPKGTDMRHYDRIFILYFRGGADNAPRNNAEDLVIKALTLGKQDQTTVISLNETGSSATYTLSEYKPTARGRVAVYVVGHGTDASDSVGGCTAKDLATTLDTISDYTLARVTFVACHSGGNGNTQAPHRFVTDFWEHAKHFVEEVVGYTGTVRMTHQAYRNTGNLADLPADAVRYRAWNEEEWWVKKGSIHKVVSHDHDEDANRRKIYISRAGGTTSRGWAGKL